MDFRLSNIIMARLFTLAIVAAILCSCQNKHGITSTTEQAIDSLIPSHTHSFRVDYYKGHKVVKVFSNGKGEPVAVYDITKPNQRVICISTTHIGAMKLLNATANIVAVANKALIYDSIICHLVASGTIKDAGKDYQPDYEVMAQVKPDVVFTDGENGGSSQIIAKMKAMGMKIVSSRDYFEQDPLARAEWIKFFAAFIDKEKLADSIFHAVQVDYQTTRNNVAETSTRPTVFCNIPYNGIWYMPCGENYAARLITDAGGAFLWNKEKPINGLNLSLNFEQVYERAAAAEFWVNQNTATTLAEVLNADKKFTLFKAAKTGSLFNGTKRMSVGGGMDIWETGAFLPNKVLRDLALIFHDKQVRDEELFYYKKLR